MKTIHRIINESAARSEMLPRSLMDIYGSLRDFYVWCDGEEGSIGGICALHIFWENIAEVRSLYVVEAYRGRGIGRELAEACSAEALMLDLARIFALTYETGFFRALKFQEVPRSSLPEKIWSDCFKCPKYPDYCDEVAMILDV